MNDFSPRIFPRYILNLNSLADHHGLRTSVFVGRSLGGWKPSDRHILCEWTGTREQLVSTELFTPKAAAATLYLPDGERQCTVPPHDAMRPMLYGHLRLEGRNFRWLIDHGPAPLSIEHRQGLEIMRYETFVRWHGCAEDLMAARVCERRQLPAGRNSTRCNTGYPDDADPITWWVRRHPDGTYVFLQETASETARRRDEWKQRYRHEEAVPIAPRHLRLVVNNERDGPLADAWTTPRS